MKISVITPSFNQARFLPHNLDSVRGQTGVAVEHIVVDPGSTDGSTELARQAPGITLIAEPDRGQSDGINKGFRRATGDVLAWLNSDDLYPDPGVLAAVATCFDAHPDVDVVYGNVEFVDEAGRFLRKGFVNAKPETLLATLQYQVGIVQPGVFWRRRVFEQLGGPSEEFEYCMDYELWVRMASRGFRWRHLPRVLAHHRWWGGMKTSSRRDLSLREHFKVCDRYFGYVHWKWLDRYAEFLCSRRDGVVNHAESVDPKEKAAAARRAIDEVVTEEMRHKLAGSNDPEQVATRQYIEATHPGRARVYFGPGELAIRTEASADPKAQQRVAWNIFEAEAADGSRYAAYHVPDNFDRYFDHAWHARQIERAAKGLAQLSRTRRGEVCVIVGNGPSLRHSDLSQLEGVDTIVSNFAVLSADLRRHARILTVVNDLVARQGAIDFNASDLAKVVPFWLGNHFNESERTFFVNATVRPEFAMDFVRSASWRSTVSFFNMQLAFALGYRKVLLIGFDNSYVQPKGMVEGTVISQTEDDENHFDPRYFKGKDWQAADTVNMEKMYVVAKAAYEKDGREIVNCTVGGKLEVFRRSDLAIELASHHAKPRGVVASVAAPRPPRLLMIDSTPVGHRSATGRLKRTFLGSWPSESFLQVWEGGGKPASLHLIRLGESIEASQARALALADIVRECSAFDPEVVYFRPIDSDGLFVVATELTRALNRPLVIHMMDDWPGRLRRTDPQRHERLDRDLRRLLAVSAARLCIGDAMAAAYGQRYGGDWQPLANGVDPADFPARSPAARPPVSATHPFVIQYMGALADDMTFASVRDVAQAVASLQGEVAVRLSVRTMDWCRDKASREMGGLPGVSIDGLVDDDAYRAQLMSADALLIAYNFDEHSQAYVGLSIANKMPECLATGVPVLAYGPPKAATIRYLQAADCALCVVQRDASALTDAIRSLVTNPSRGREFGERARRWVERHLQQRDVQARFQQHMRDAASRPASAGGAATEPSLVGPFDRAQGAHWDETHAVADMLTGNGMTGVLIDVGAHHGTSLLPFLGHGWTVYAFEPDESNRAVLLRQLDGHPYRDRVTLDIRCVGERSQSDLPFYRSRESTGISGLSAFHVSHQQAQTVNLVSLTDYFRNRDLAPVDFLKIDTEGHDLFVLRGYPWHRAKPRVIECEFEDAKTEALGYRFGEMADFLVAKGYQVYVSEWHPIVRYGIRHQWHRLVRYPCRLSDPKSWGNLLAFRDAGDEAALVPAVQARLAFHPPKPVSAAPTITAPAAAAPPGHATVGSLQVTHGAGFVHARRGHWNGTASSGVGTWWQASYSADAASDAIEFVAGVRVRSPVALDVRLRLFSPGGGASSESVAQSRTLPGVPMSLRLRHRFAGTPQAVALRLEVAPEPGPSGSTLEIDSAFILEALDAFASRRAADTLSVAEGNRLFRVGSDAQALLIYLELMRTRGLPMYAANALRTARRLSIHDVSTAQELLQRLH